MGNVLARRQNARIEEIENGGHNQAYLYPPKNGNYFSSHFIMGGERFETCHPEMYLFGENFDLNFLGGRPTPFPYTAPLPHEPTRTLRALINIRKESLRFVKAWKDVPLDKADIPIPNEPAPPPPGNQPPSNLNLSASESHTRQSSISSSHGNRSSNVSTSTTQQQQAPSPAPPTSPKKYYYNIEFTFDTDVKCAITIHYFCNEEINANGVTYVSRDPQLNSETYQFKRGANQQFTAPTHIFEPSSHDEDDMMYRAFDEMGHFDPRVPFPVVIQAVALEGDEPRQSHSLIAVIERNHDGSFSLKPFKQKTFIDGLCYLLQEMYGIENKSAALHRSSDQYVSPDDDMDDNGQAECVICMSDSRDTLILPCRHLCLCNACADSLRYQANNCPICRAPFRALLQIKAVRKSPSAVIPLNPAAATPPSHMPSHQAHHHHMSASSTDLVDVPPGYEPYPLLEALNGPNINHSSTLQSHGMYAFVNASQQTTNEHTPRRHHRHRDKHHRDRSDATSQSSGHTGRRKESGASLTPRGQRGSTGAPLPSPSTPEVVVSGRPMSPEKPSAVGHDKWPLPSKKDLSTPHAIERDHESSASSISSNGQAERTRLLAAHEIEDIENGQQNAPPVPRPRQSRNRGGDTGEKLTERPSSFKTGKGKSPRKSQARSVSNEICSPTGTESPMSSVAGGAANDLRSGLVSLRDGFDEQRCMADTDLVSVGPGSVGNMALLGSSREAEDDDVDDETFAFTKHEDDLPDDNRLSLIELNKLTTMVKLAESEATDDLDLSPIED